MDKKEIASKVDHTLLRPNARSSDIMILCLQAIENNFRAVCVNPEWVHFAKDKLRKLSKGKSTVKVAQVYNFPTSKSSLITGDEIDVLIPCKGVLRNKSTKLYYEMMVNHYLDLFEQAGKKREIVKVIIETRVLQPKEIKYVSRVLQKLGVGCIKTSTGLYKRMNQRTNLQDLKLIRSAISKPTVLFRYFHPFKWIKPNTKSLKFTKALFGIKKMRIGIPVGLSFYKPKIKVAGGIKTYEEAIELIKNGADYLGSSSGTKLLTPTEKKEIKDVGRKK